MCKKRCTHIVDCSNRPSGTRAALLHSGTPQWCIPAIQMKFWHTNTFNIAYMSILIRESDFLIDKGFSFFKNPPCSKSLRQLLLGSLAELALIALSKTYWVVTPGKSICASMSTKISIRK